MNGKGMKIGAPADSLNSLVVNAVDYSGKSASYTRSGPVLSFFNKPDLSYYGGTDEDRINVYAPYGKRGAYGTSFAAPWITRKMAFLIYKMGLTREVAKALLIDSAAGWKQRRRWCFAPGRRRSFSFPISREPRGWLFPRDTRRYDRLPKSRRKAGTALFRRADFP